MILKINLNVPWSLDVLTVSTPVSWTAEPVWFDNVKTQLTNNYDKWKWNWHSTHWQCHSIFIFSAVQDYSIDLLVPIFPSNTPVIFTQYCACKSLILNYGSDHEYDHNQDDEQSELLNILMTMMTIRMSVITSKTCAQSVRKCGTTILNLIGDIIIMIITMMTIKMMTMITMSMINWPQRHVSSQ